MAHPLGGLAALTDRYDVEVPALPSYGPDRDMAGQPDIAYCDAFGRPIATFCFPFIPGTVVRIGDHTLTMTQTRDEAEQAAVSKMFNSSGIFVPRARAVPMHASHGSKHGLCGSSYRTNFHAVSATCNTVTIKQFETELESLVRAVYSGAPHAPLDMWLAPNVVVHATFTVFSPAQVLAYLVGGANAAKVAHHRKTNLVCGILWSLAESIPYAQVREAWVGNRTLHGTRAWACAFRQPLTLPQIMEDAGTPDAPRYEMRWDSAFEGSVIARWMESYAAAVTGVPALGTAANIDDVAVNCTMFEFLSQESQFSSSGVWNIMRGQCMTAGATNPVQVLTVLMSERYPRLPSHTRHERSIRDVFALHRSSRDRGGYCWSRTEALAYIAAFAKGDLELLARWTKMFVDEMFPPETAAAAAATTSWP